MSATERVWFAMAFPASLSPAIALLETISRIMDPIDVVRSIVMLTNLSVVGGGSTAPNLPPVSSLIAKTRKYFLDTFDLKLKSAVGKTRLKINVSLPLLLSAKTETE